jgi:hypothetical protein
MIQTWKNQACDIPSLFAPIPLATVKMGDPKATSVPAAISVVPRRLWLSHRRWRVGEPRHHRVVYIVPSRFVLGRIGFPLAAMRHRRELFSASSPAVSPSEAFVGDLFCSSSSSCSVVAVGSDTIFRKLWRLVDVFFLCGGGGGSVWEGFSPFCFCVWVVGLCGCRWPIWFRVTGGLTSDGRIVSCPVKLGVVVADIHSAFYCATWEWIQVASSCGSSMLWDSASWWTGGWCFGVCSSAANGGLLRVSVFISVQLVHHITHVLL